MDSRLGKLGKDKVTGYVGVITAVAEHLYGCNTIFLTAKVDGENKRNDSGNGWYDEGRIDIIAEDSKPEDYKTETGKTGAEPVGRMM